MANHHLIHRLRAQRTSFVGSGLALFAGLLSKTAWQDDSAM
jgi:hypothetical protein